MSNKKVILVSGASGQLGSSLRENQKKYQQNFHFIFADRSMLDLCSEQSIRDTIQKVKPDIFLNFAAYTQVDNAEKKIKEAFLINEKASALIAESCKKINCHLIHISTDYVYAGNGLEAYKESDPCDPINVYGKSKRAGEQSILKLCNSAVILRTSWLYSKHGNNFVKSMIRLGTERDALNIVNDQIGSPTWTEDLIEAIFSLITNNCSGIFNYSNEGSCTWFEFAENIMELMDIKCAVHPIPSSEFPTPAKRPLFSLMDKSKIKNHTGLAIPHWKDALKKALKGF